MKKLILVTVLSIVSLVLAACGGDDNSESEGNDNGASTNTVDLVASNWEFDQDTYTVPAGDVTVNLSNADGYHGIEVEGTDIEIDGEGSATGSLDAGEYTIRCIIPCGNGHDEMVSTLVVE